MDDETRKKMNVEETFAAIDKIIGRRSQRPRQSYILIFRRRPGTRRRSLRR